MSAYLYVILLLYLIGSAIVFSASSSVITAEQIHHDVLLTSLLFFNSALSSTMPYWFDILSIYFVRQEYVKEVTSINLSGEVSEATRSGMEHCSNSRDQCRRSYQRRSAPLAWAVASQVLGHSLTADELVSRYRERFPAMEIPEASPSYPKRS